MVFLPLQPVRDGKSHTPWIIRTLSIPKVVELLLVEIVPNIFQVLSRTFDHLNVRMPPFYIKEFLLSCPQWFLKKEKGMLVPPPILIVFFSPILTYFVSALF